MRLVVLSYRLTKIKGVLVSVGICALTNATMFMGPVAGAAGIVLALSSAARAVPPTGCNAGNANGTITSSTGTALLWTAPTVCTVAAGTIAMSNGDALTASGSDLVHQALANNGYLHASLTGTVLSAATISGFSNLVNVGSIDNVAGATIQGDYLPGTMAPPLSPAFRPFFVNPSGLSGAGNSFTIYGVDNQLGATIGSLSNEGQILSTVVSGIGPNTVSDGILVGLDNDGVITGSLSNSGTISASFNIGAGVSSTSNVLSAAGIINSNQIGALTNSGLITGGTVGLFNQGTIGTFSNSAGAVLSATNASNATALHNTGYIGAVTNAGWVQGPAALVNSGTLVSFSNAATGIVAATAGDAISNVGGSIGTLSNAGIIQTTNTAANGGGFVAIRNDPGSTIGLLSNTGTIISDATGSMIGNLNETALLNIGVIGTLTNSGLISGTIIGAGITNYGSISLLSNLATGSIAGTIGGTYGIVNTGGEGGGIIEMLINAGLINGTHTGLYNSGTIGTLTNSGKISGAYNGIEDAGLITALDNSGSIGGQYDAIHVGGAIGTLVNGGTIGAVHTGLGNYGQVSSLTNHGAISGGNDYGIFDDQFGSIGSVTNTGTITGGNTGVLNNGVITALVNSGTISGVAVDGIVNVGAEGGPATIGAITNSGVIAGLSAGIYNGSTIGTLMNALAGTIRGGVTGIDNDALIGTLTNAGTIAGAAGAGLRSQGMLGLVTNTGHITGSTAGVWNGHETLGTLTNSGTIEATGALGDGVYNSGSIASLTNSGLIHGAGSGVYNHAAQAPTLQPETPPLGLPPASAIESLSNSSTGTISGAATGLYNASRFGTVSNAGLISGGSKVGIQNLGSLGTLTSSGLISGAVGVANSGGSIGSLDNSGTINGTLSDGVSADGTIGAMTNEGTLTGAVNALHIDSSGSVAALANTGLISAPTAIDVAAGGSLGPLANAGTVAGSIVNASTHDLSISGGTGSVFGTLTGYGGGLAAGDIGQITNTVSNVAFTSGNVLLNDHVSVGTGTVTNAALLQVDNPINIKGNYLQSVAGTLSVGVASVSDHGELDVSSAATVDAGGHVALSRLGGFRFAAGESFTLIEAASATYNAAGMTALAAGFDGGYSISEVQIGAETDLVVCLTNAVTPNCDPKKAPTYSLATTQNAIIANNAIGNYTGDNAALKNLANAVLALGTSPAANRAGNQLLADPHNNGTGLAMQPSLDVLNVVTGHADSTRFAANRGESGVSTGESGPGFATWGEAFGGGSHQSEDGQFSGYSMSSEGIVAGGDALIADSDTRVGGVFSYTHADLHDHGDRAGDTLALDSYGMLGYASYLGPRAYADLLGGVLFDQFDTVRVVDITGFNGVATGTHDGTQYVVKAAGGYRLPMSASPGTTFTPLWGLTYSHLNQDGYTESGGNGAALRVAREGDNSLKGELGFKLEKSFALAHGDVVPELRVLYRHEFDSGALLQTASFAADASATAFSTFDARPIENSGLASIGVNLLGNDGVTVTLKYTAEIATGYVSQGGSLRVRWAF
jgi:outer membrane autotransporter protein